MTIDQFNILNSHLGYGDKSAKLIFLGLEEAAEDDPTLLLANYVYRWNYITNEIMDLKAFHTNPAAPISMQRWFLPPYPMQRTWAKIAKLILMSQGQSLNQAHDGRHPFIQNTLGTIKRKHLLLELLPLPRKNHDYWNHVMSVHGLFSTLGGYYATPSIIKRITRIRDIIVSNAENSKSKVVVYGKAKHQRVIHWFSAIGDPLIYSADIIPNRIILYHLSSNRNVEFFFVPHMVQGINNHELTVLAGNL
jgi:hypothetical protein